MKRVSSKLFFAVLWKGMCQATKWFFGLFGYKKDGLFACCVWRLFTASVTLVVGFFTVLLVCGVGSGFYNRYIKETYCYDPDCPRSEYIGKNIYYHDSGIGKSYVRLLNDHLKKYQAQYNRVSLTLPKSDKEKLPTDKRLETFDGTDLGLVALMMQYGRYLLISSSQPGGQPANLQGVWNDKINAPWDSKYTININAEMNYWPALVGNLAETQQPLFSMVKDLSQTGQLTAREMYGCDGWVAHHNTDLWRIAGPVDGTNWGMFPTGGARRTCGWHQLGNVPYWRCLAHHPPLAALSLHWRQGFPAYLLPHHGRRRQVPRAVYANLSQGW